jgi:hypothetical protein
MNDHEPKSEAYKNAYEADKVAYQKANETGVKHYATWSNHVLSHNEFMSYSKEAQKLGKDFYKVRSLWTKKSAAPSNNLSATDNSTLSFFKHQSDNKGKLAR